MAGFRLSRLDRGEHGGLVVNLMKKIRFLERFSAQAEKVARSRFSSELEKFRPGAFPLISADTFRLMADFVVDEAGVKRFPRRSSSSVTYLDMRFFQHGPHSIELSDIPGLDDARATSEGSEDSVLIITNADIPPSDLQLAELSNSFSRIYCTNISAEWGNVFAIPVGIENLYRLTNGIPWKFMEERRTNPIVRGHSVFACFKISTNKEARTGVRDLVRASRHHFCDERLSPDQFREKVRAAKFVISPPGNGPDCHRTWEAIYLGAVPVVLAGTLPEVFVRQLPILEVSGYEEFLSLTENELESLFLSIREKSTQMAFMPFWVEKIFSYQSGT